MANYKVETNPIVFKKIQTQSKMFGREVMFLGVLVGELKDNTFYVNDIIFPEHFVTNISSTKIIGKEIVKTYISLTKQKKKIIGLLHFTGCYYLPFICSTTVKTFYSLFNSPAILLEYNKYDDWQYLINNHYPSSYISGDEDEILAKSGVFTTSRSDEDYYEEDDDYDYDDEEEDE